MDRWMLMLDVGCSCWWNSCPWEWLWEGNSCLDALAGGGRNKGRAVKRLSKTHKKSNLKKEKKSEE